MIFHHSCKNNTGNGEHQVIAPCRPKVRLHKKIRDEVLSQIHEEGMVIVHCTYHAEIDGGIRVWKTTFLVDKASGERSPLHHAERISVAPAWTWVPEGKTYRFTLIFAPLPKSCELFDLLEDIPQPGGFFVQNIRRNKSDVYHVNIL
jgi:hypothetical protein